MRYKTKVAEQELCFVMDEFFVSLKDATEDGYMEVKVGDYIIESKTKSDYSKEAFDKEDISINITEVIEIIDHDKGLYKGRDYMLEKEELLKSSKDNKLPIDTIRGQRFFLNITTVILMINKIVDEMAEERKRQALEQGKTDETTRI